MNLGQFNPVFALNDTQRPALRKAFYNVLINATEMRDMFTQFIEDDIKAIAQAKQGKIHTDLLLSMGTKAQTRDTLNNVVSRIAHWTPEHFQSESEETILTEMLRVANDAALRAMYTESMTAISRKLVNYIDDALREIGLPSLNPLFDGTE